MLLLMMNVVLVKVMDFAPVHIAIGFVLAQPGLNVATLAFNSLEFVVQWCATRAERLFLLVRKSELGS
jgi:hypothetical protein